MQNLFMLSTCVVTAIDLRRFNKRHGLVLEKILEGHQSHLTEKTSVTVAIDGNYEFPSHIVPTDIHPDIFGGMILGGPPAWSS